MKPQFFIQQGVRRARSALEAGLKDIVAIIFDPGKPAVTIRIGLDQLHSPKFSIARDIRYLTSLSKWHMGISQLPIEVEPLGVSGQQRGHVPLAMVQLT